MADRSGWIEFATGSLAPATGVGTTRVLPYASASVILRAVPLTGKPALQTRFAPDAAASTASRPAFVTTRDPPLLSRRDSAEIATDLGEEGSCLFLGSWLDDPNQFESVD
jgi:hypothetical protein